MPQSRLPLAAIATALMLWLTGPTVNAWPLAFIALTPLLFWTRVANQGDQPPPRAKRIIYLAFFAYFLLSLQGLRYAHPLMFMPLMAMAAYLAVYPLLFFVLLRKWNGLLRKWNGLLRESNGLKRNWHGPFYAAALWVGGEWVRNYFATGISVLMLGHSLTDMPGGQLLQIADLGGTYAVSLLLVFVNVAVTDIILFVRSKDSSWKISVPIAAVLLIASFLYGNIRLGEPLKESDTTILLVGRDEQTEYQQDLQRELDVYRAYARQTIRAVQGSDQTINAVVWPESMLSGGQPWLTVEDNLVVPDQAGGQKLNFTEPEFRQVIGQTQNDFRLRSIDLLTAIGLDRGPPSIIGGCGLVRYGEIPRQHSGVVHIDASGSVVGTYAKNHLVMFGEYIPLVKSIPWVRDFVPRGLGLDAGDGPEIFQVGNLKVLPNLCIETAVERIAIDHLRHVDRADVIVTLTNDAWFDHSAVVGHHLRCAQMVAIGCRRPILSAANGGPTAWIDSSGQIVEKLAYDEPGEIFATPSLDRRQSLYVRFGAWPSSIFAIVFLIACFNGVASWRRGE